MTSSVVRRCAIRNNFRLAAATSSGAKEIEVGRFSGGSLMLLTNLKMNAAITLESLKKQENFNSLSGAGIKMVRHADLTSGGFLIRVDNG